MPMIIPVIRASLGRREALQLVDLLGRRDAGLREGARARLESDGVDGLLDDPRTLNALLTEEDVKSRPELVFYVLVRQSLLERGIDDPVAADYVASMLLRFGQRRRAYRISDGGAEEYGYLVDLTAKLRTAGPEEAFLLRAHMGNFALWLSGLFPDYLDARVQRRGGPPIAYYESVGSAGYQTASESPRAEALGVKDALASVATHFTRVRAALNRLSDRYLWRSGSNPVGRLLREVSYAAE
jgi:hypothetical protein